MNISKRPIFRVMCAGLLAAAIVGCGNKGPLILPAKPVPAEPATLPADVVEPADEHAADQPAPDQEQPAAADETQPGR